MRKETWKQLSIPQRNRLRDGEAVLPPPQTDDADLNNAYLQRRGMGRQVRLEYELLTVEDIRWIAVELARMSEALSEIAWQSDDAPLMRVLAARRVIWSKERTGPRLRARKKRRLIADVVRDIAAKK